MAVQSFTKQDATATRRRFFIFCVNETDGITIETGEDGGQPQFSKNGAVFVNTDGVLVAVGNGSYYVELTTVELDTLGKILVRYKSANTAEFQDVGSVERDASGDSAAEVAELRIEIIKMRTVLNWVKWKVQEQEEEQIQQQALTQE